MEAMGWTSYPERFLKDSGWYAENTEWVWGEGNERVWIAAGRQQPRDFEEWSKQWPKHFPAAPPEREYPEPPEPTAKPDTVRREA